MSRERGFTLVEVMVATAMLSTAIYFSMSTIDLIAASQSRTTRFSKAQNVADSLIEQLLSVYPTDGKLTEGPHTLNYDSDGNLVATGGVYTAQWTVTLNTPITKIMQIQLYLQWTEDGHTRSLHFQTFRQS